MGRSYCWIAGCKTGYASDRKTIKAEGKRMPSLFVPPRDIHLFEKWKRAIGTPGKELTRKDRVCEYHFAKEDIQRYYVHKLTNGTTDMMERGLPILRAGAVPFLNPNQTQRTRKKRHARKAEPRNKATKSKVCKNYEKRNTQADEMENSAMSIMENVHDGVTDPSVDDKCTDAIEDETNDETKDPEVDEQKSPTCAMNTVTNRLSNVRSTLADDTCSDATDDETDDRENDLKLESTTSAMNIIKNLLGEATDPLTDDVRADAIENETNDRTKYPKVNEPKTTIPIIITDVRSMDNTSSFGEGSKDPHFPDLRVARGQKINIKRVEIKRPVRLVQVRPKIMLERPNVREHFENESSPSCSRKQTYMESLEERLASFEPPSTCKLEGRSTEERTNTGGQFIKRNQPEDDEYFENARTKRQRQDTERLLEGLPLTLQSSILERLDSMNRNIETNTCALSILSKTISDSSKENVRALNSLTAAITKVGNLLFESLDQKGRTDTE